MLNQIQMEEFQSQGYLLVESVLDPVEILDSIISEYAMLLDGLVRSFMA